MRRPYLFCSETFRSKIRIHHVGRLRRLVCALIICDYDLILHLTCLSPFSVALISLPLIALVFLRSTSPQPSHLRDVFGHGPSLIAWLHHDDEHCAKVLQQCEQMTVKRGSADVTVDLRVESAREWPYISSPSLFRTAAHHPIVQSGPLRPVPRLPFSSPSRG